MQTNSFIDLSNQDLEIIRSETLAALKKWDNKHDVYGGAHKGNTWLGYQCEMAVAYFLGLPYKLERDRTKNDGDVAGYQVKGTAHAGGWMNTRDDMPSGIYIGCLALSGEPVQILGWSTSRKMRQKMYWNDNPKMKRPCYSMPPDQMYDIETLPATAQLIKLRELWS